MKKGISIGLVGLGAFGSGFADLFKRHPFVKRVGLCDLETERIKKFAERKDWQDKFSAKDAYTSLEDICQADFDSLVIMTQPWLHAPQCIKAMESGKHVYSAVPIISLPDGDEILDWVDKLVNTVEKTGLHYMLGETTYYRPETMYCRRRTEAGDFGHFVYSEGEYFHDFDTPISDLREVAKRRFKGKAGQSWKKQIKKYQNNNILNGPMHYPTHSVSGPITVMNARPLKVSCWGEGPYSDDSYFNNSAFSNETALFKMDNGTTMRICEYREISFGRENFRVYGTEGSFEHNAWITHEGKTQLSIKDMRDKLPEEVIEAWKNTETESVNYGGHGGSHAYLVHEFVDAIYNNRVPAINVWTAARFMAAGVMAHKSALKEGEILEIPDWGDPKF